MNYHDLAIADCLKHPTLGVVSHQPDLREPVSDRIRVRDSKGKVHYIQASECTKSTPEELIEYWREFPRGELIE